MRPKFTEEQKRIIDHPNGVFVQACPGAGKTETLVFRLERIVKSLPPRRGVAVLSFSRTAVEEFKSRCHRYGLSDALRFPGFIGTVDSFIVQMLFLPRAGGGSKCRLRVVDNWSAINAIVRPPGKEFNGKGVELECFRPVTNDINFRLVKDWLRHYVRVHEDAYKQAAASCRELLHKKGYFSVADVRVRIDDWLQDARWSGAVGRMLAARFAEVIVDEAQDCNPLDCRIIEWLLDSGVRVTVVADPDQAIYGFRHSHPIRLGEITERYAEGNRLALTGNFRCSQNICNVASTLRSSSEPDTALGETASAREPVHLVFYRYRKGKIPSAISAKFLELMESCGISASDGIILSHARANALRARGVTGVEKLGNTKTTVVAKAVAAFHTSLPSDRIREYAVQSVERVILELMGKLRRSELPAEAIERHDLDTRWLRRCAVNVLTQLSPTCGSSERERKEWIERLRNAIEDLNLELPPGMTVKKYFPERSDADWHRVLLPRNSRAELLVATVHEAKGRAYDAVCVVIPPDSSDRRTESLIKNWKNRVDDEAKRVIYVAITRARRLAMMAIPIDYRDEVSSILRSMLDDCCRIHEI